MQLACCISKHTRGTLCLLDYTAYKGCFSFASSPFCPFDKRFVFGISHMAQATRAPCISTVSAFCLKKHLVNRQFIRIS